MSEAEQLLVDALSTEWQEEDVLVRYVHTHARRSVSEQEIRHALDRLGVTRRAEAKRFPGYSRSHWRRINARRVA
jgi:hypothetical protein